jgi:hypothetical protein
VIARVRGKGLLVALLGSSIGYHEHLPSPNTHIFVVVVVVLCEELR